MFDESLKISTTMIRLVRQIISTFRRLFETMFDGIAKFKSFHFVWCVHKNETGAGRVRKYLFFETLIYEGGFQLVARLHKSEDLLSTFCLQEHETTPSL